MPFGDSFVGVTADFYAILEEYDSIMSFLSGKTTNVTIEGTAYVVFSGIDEMELLELLEDTELDFEVLYFAYIKSTWSVDGI